MTRCTQCEREILEPATTCGVCGDVPTVRQDRGAADCREDTGGGLSRASHRQSPLSRRQAPWSRCTACNRKAPRRVARSSCCP